MDFQMELLDIQEARLALAEQRMEEKVALAEQKLALREERNFASATACGCSSQNHVVRCCGGSSGQIVGPRAD
jgi:hypothetical protein